MPPPGGQPMPYQQPAKKQTVEKVSHHAAPGGVAEEREEVEYEDPNAGGYSGLKRLVGKVVDYIPGVSNAKGAIEGDWEQAVAGPIAAASEDINKISGGRIPDVVGAAGSAARQGAAALAGGLAGLAPGGSVDTSQITQDVDASRRTRERFMGELDAYQRRTAPTMATPQIGQMAGYQAASVGPVERAHAGSVSAAEIDPIRQAYADQIGAAQIDPVERAEAERIQAERVGAVDPVTGQRIDTGNQDQVRARQMDLLSMLEAAAAGRGGPSPAELMLQRAAERSAAQQFGMAQAARGQSAGSALRQAMMGAANIHAQQSADAAILRAQEQDQARRSLIGALEATRGADIGIATQQAQLLQQAGLQNQQTALARTLEQARLGQAASTANQEAALRASLANQQAYNTRAIQQAQFTQQADLANQDARLRADLANQSAYNTRAIQQAQLGQQAALANQDADLRAALANQQAYNTARLQQAQLDSRASEFGADAANRAALEQARLAGVAGQANLQSQLDTTRMDDAYQEALRRAMLDSQQQAISGSSAAAQAAAAAQGAKMQFYGNMIGAGAQALPALAALSDKRRKKLVKDMDEDDLEEFLGALRAKSYEYKDPDEPGAARGRRYGIMAQDLEKSRVGKSLVRTGPGGSKMIDVPQAVGAVLAALKSVHDRAKASEAA